MSHTGAPDSYTLSAYWRILSGNRNFRLLWSAQVVSEIGDWLYSVAIYSLLLDLTHSAKSVGFAVVLQLLPQVFMAPMAGVINDRINRRAVMIFADIARIFIVASMIFVNSVETVWLIWVLLFLETIMWALFEPGRSAILPTVCRDDSELLAANALSSTTWAVNLTIGSGIGGLVAVVFGRHAVFALNAASFIVSACLLGMMRIRETHVDHLPAFRFKDLLDIKPVWEGILYVRQDVRTIATLLVKAGMGLLGAHWVILPIFGERVFPIHAAGLDGSRGGALAMSLLLGSRGVGALIGSFASGYIGRNENPRMRRGIFWGFILVAFSYMLLSGAPTLWLACLAVMAGHAGTSTAWVFSTTMLQQSTDDRFRGRIFSADFGGLFLVMSGVSFLAGVFVDMGIGIRPIAFWTGVLGFVPAFLWLSAQRFWKSHAAQTR